MVLMVPRAVPGRVIKAAFPVYSGRYTLPVPHGPQRVSLANQRGSPIMYE